MKRTDEYRKKYEGVTYIQLKFWNKGKNVRRGIQRRKGRGFSGIEEGGECSDQKRASRVGQND